jgi:cold shock CspA family protein
MMPQGTIKDYDEQARAGSLLQDDRTEIFIDRTSTEGSNVRTLRIGQRVSFEVTDEGGRPVARGLRLVTFS